MFWVLKKSARRVLLRLRMKLERDPKDADIVDYMRSPETMVRAFIAEHELWNARAMDRDGKNPDPCKKPPAQSPERAMWSMDAAEVDYGKLIARFCYPGFKHSNIAYGTPEPNPEVIVEVVTHGFKSVVRTSRVYRCGSFASNYEYHLLKKGQRWYLMSSYFVDGRRKYEGL